MTVNPSGRSKPQTEMPAGRRVGETVVQQLHVDDGEIGFRGEAEGPGARRAIASSSPPLRRYTASSNCRVDSCCCARRDAVAGPPTNLPTCVQDAPEGGERRHQPGLRGGQ